MNANPLGVQIYKGKPEDNAQKLYKKDKVPFCWGYVIEKNDFGQLYILDMLNNSEHTVDENGNVIKYDRNFFDSIVFDSGLKERLLKKLDGILRKEDKKIIKEYEKCSDTTEIEQAIVQIQIEYLFADHQNLIEKEIKKILPKDRSLIKENITFAIKFNTDNLETSFDSYSSLY